MTMLTNILSSTHLHSSIVGKSSAAVIVIVDTMAWREGKN